MSMVVRLSCRDWWFVVNGETHFKNLFGRCFLRGTDMRSKDFPFWFFSLGEVRGIKFLKMKRSCGEEI